MNTKQKMKYTALGAVIMRIGVGVGSMLTPQLIAQHYGVFDTITCRRMKVVDNTGKVKVALTGYENGRDVTILDKDENTAIVLAANEKGNGVFAYRADKMSVGFLNSKNGSELSIMDKEGKEAIVLGASKRGNAKQTMWNPPKEEQ